MATIEDRVSGIVVAVLQKEKIGREETFVDLGGDSLAAMLCISRIRKEFGVELSVEDFFSGDATTKGLSELIVALTHEVQ